MVLSILVTSNVFRSTLIFLFWHQSEVDLCNSILCLGHFIQHNACSDRTCLSMHNIFIPFKKKSSILQAPYFGYPFIYDGHLCLVFGYWECRCDEQGIGDSGQVGGFSLLCTDVVAELMDHMITILRLKFQETCELFSIHAAHLIFGIPTSDL